MRYHAGFVCVALISAFISPVSAQTRYSYDELGRLVKVERIDANKTTNYSYDNLGNRQTVTQATSGAVEFAINDASISEGGVLNFLVSKSGQSLQSHSVSFATASGTADATDFSARSGVLHFSPTDVSKTVTVQTSEDAVYESAESLSVVLSNPTGGAAVIDGQGVGIIENDDNAPRFSINNTAANEGSALTFTVTKSGATAFTHTVAYQTVDDFAVAPDDYTATSGVLSFSPGQSSRSIMVSTVANPANEPSAQFFVDLSTPSSGATISDGRGIGVINNDYVNSPPVAVNDHASGTESRAVYLAPLTNDSDPDGHALTLTVLAKSSSALSVLWSAGNGLMELYAPYSGSYWVDYRISDGYGGTDTARVSLSLSSSSGGGGVEP